MYIRGCVWNLLQLRASPTPPPSTRHGHGPSHAPPLCPWWPAPGRCRCGRCAIMKVPPALVCVTCRRDAARTLPVELRRATGIPVIGLPLGLWTSPRMVPRPRCRTAHSANDQRAPPCLGLDSMSAGRGFWCGCCRRGAVQVRVGQPPDQRRWRSLWRCVGATGLSHHRRGQLRPG